ncbi:MAG: methyltransferase domain-containing protein [Gemmatimonas sp.]|nr:methyltransferase domain-containing protein [Gemmatimonas sp.]
MSTRREDRDAWDAIASFWHDRMGEGNDFVDLLIWPIVRRLLPPLEGLRVIDIGCGNGLFSRKLAAEGARVYAFDYSTNMIDHARAATREHAIEYDVLDAVDPDDLAQLPTDRFDAALCTMVLMDMRNVEPLMSVLPRILARGASFVFATAHPCFNSPHARLENFGRDGEGSPTSVRVEAYRTPSRSRDMAMTGQPVRTLFFHRSISDLLRPAFAAGFVLDALEEPSFSPDHRGGRASSWGGRFHEFPPVLAGRFRKRKQE